MGSRRSLLFTAALCTLGCGTIATQVIPEETCTYAANHQERSGCKGISRVYSGVQGNLCWLDPR